VQNRDFRSKRRSRQKTDFGRLVEAWQPPFRTRSAITLRSPSALRVGTMRLCVLF
jgi:hypothetical protein